MTKFVVRITMPKGYDDEKISDIEEIIEKAITILNPDIKVAFGNYFPGTKWYKSIYATKKSLDKE